MLKSSHGFTKILLSILLVGIISIGLAGESKAEKDTIVISQSADITTLDSTQATQIVNLNLFYNIYDALVTWNPDDIGALEPELAVSWKTIDPVTWQFKLREGVKFHNGEPFDAESVKFTVERLITKGVHQVYSGFATIDRAEIVDPYTVNIITQKPDPLLVKRFAAYGGQMLPSKYIKEVGWETFGIKPVGTGPYKFMEWMKDDHVTLVANEDYWRGVPRIKKVIWRPIPDNFARVAALTQGEVDIATRIIPDHAQLVKDAKNCHLDHPLSSNVTVYWFNIAKGGPFENQKVRQALNYAIDKEKIIKELFRGYAIPIASEIPTTDFGYNPNVKPYPYDPAKAKSLLAEAGYPNGFEFAIESGNGIHLNDKQLTEAMGAMYQEIGLRPRIEILEPATRMQRLRAQSFSLLLVDPASTTYDTDGVLWRLRGPGGLAHKIWPGDYEGTPVYKMMEEARYSLDQEKRKKIYNEVAQILHDQAVAVFLFQGELLEGINNELNYKARPDQRIYVYSISFR